MKWIQEVDQDNRDYIKWWMIFIDITSLESHQSWLGHVFMNIWYQEFHKDLDDPLSDLQGLSTTIIAQALQRESDFIEIHLANVQE
jgi:hypothetical protein